jgi:hypothetical protein
MSLPPALRHDWRHQVLVGLYNVGSWLGLDLNEGGHREHKRRISRPNNRVAAPNGARRKMCADRINLSGKNPPLALKLNLTEEEPALITPISGSVAAVFMLKRGRPRPAYR